MKFSIIMPIYNAEKYLHSGVQSVLYQSYKDFEIVLIDDGSTDNSANLCDQYAQQYPEKIRVIHQQNRGQLISRCNGIKAAKGEYCIFLDADDLIVDNALEFLSDTINNHNSPDMVIYSFFYESEDGGQRRAVKLFEDNSLFNQDNKKELYQAFFTSTGLNSVCTRAVKRSVLNSIDFDFSHFSTLRCSEDRLHSMVMIDACETVVYRYEPLYIYKLVEGSVTRRYEVSSISKFNNSSLYECEKAFVYKWDLQNKEYKDKIQAKFVAQMLYILDLYYNKVEKKDREKVLKYNWHSFLNEEIISSIRTNPYLNDTQKKLWKWLNDKDYRLLKNHFFIKKIRKVLRNVKHKMLLKRGD